MKAKKALFLIVLPVLISVSPVAAEEEIGISLSVGVGGTFDIAPYGLEKTYFCLQAGLATTGTISFAFRPSFSFRENEEMFRFPVTINYSVFSEEEAKFLLAFYGGGGVEIYRSEDHNTESLLLTGGVSCSLDKFFLEIPVVTTFRSYNTDSDISFLAGMKFRF